MLSLAGMKVSTGRAEHTFTLDKTLLKSHLKPVFCVQVSKPSQEAYQNELNIESVERSFILSAG